MAEPKLIMLDEPAAGINPTLAKKLGEHILALKARGITFLIIEHNMGLVAALCDHVVVLVQGKRFTEGRFADCAPTPRAGSLYGASGMMLSVTNVVAGYGAHDEVLKGVGITVAEREMVVLIGPNGAGKSTLLKSIAGFLKPREGAITFEGKPIGGLKPREITRQGIAFVPQEANVFPSLSVEANLEMGGYVDRRATKERMQARLRALSDARRAPQPGGAHALRRPAPDARGGDGADGGAAADAARRAVGRPLARRRAGIVRADQGPARAKA